MATTTEEVADGDRAPPPENQSDPPSPARPQLTATAVAASGLFAVALLGLIYVGRPVLLPLAAALLLSFVLKPLVRALAYLRFPAPLSALLIVTLVGGALVYGVYSLAEPARQWLDEAPRSLRQLEYRMRHLTESLSQFQAATEEVSKLGQGAADKEAKEVVVVESELDSQILLKTQEAAVGIFTALILLFFILGWGERLYRNTVNSLPHFREQRQAVIIAQEVERSITTYLVTITVINFLLGVVVGGVMYLMGMPNPMLWGVMAGVNNYVPYLGPAITAVVLAFVALVSYPTVAEALMVPAVFLVITSLEGYIITPMAVGRRLTLNPLLIMLSLMFWFWMWGVVGALLTVPALVCVKVVFERVEALQPLARILD